MIRYRRNLWGYRAQAPAPSRWWAWLVRAFRNTSGEGRQPAPERQG